MVRNIYNETFPNLDIDADFALREQSLEDTEIFLTYYSNPEVHRYILATPPTTLSDAADEIHYCRNLFYQKKGIYWSLVQRNTNRMVGAAGLYINLHHQRAELSYDLSKDYWRQGIMFKALWRLLEFSFHYMQLRRVEAVTLTENVPSQRILQKMGFTHEGLLRQYRYYNGKNHDVEMLAITPEMFAQHKELLFPEPKRQVELQEYL